MGNSTTQQSKGVMSMQAVPPECLPHDGQNKKSCKSKTNHLGTAPSRQSASSTFKYDWLPTKAALDEKAISSCKALFLGKGDHHRSAQEFIELAKLHPMEFATTLLACMSFVELSPGVKTRVLVAALVHNRALARHLLRSPQMSVNGLPQVVTAIRQLDAKRQAKALARKAGLDVAEIESSLRDEAAHATKNNEAGDQSKNSMGGKEAYTAGNAVTMTAKSKARAEKKKRDATNAVKDLLRECVSGCTLSGSVVKVLKTWVHGLSAAQLEALTLRWELPLAPWREISDLLHLSDSDFQLSWFGPWAHGSPPPTGSKADLCGKADGDAGLTGLVKLLDSMPEATVPPYQLLRQKFERCLRPKEKAEHTICSDLKLRIAEGQTLDTILWYFEELAEGAPAVQDHIISRISKGEVPSTLGVGKLMERLTAMAKCSPAVVAALTPCVEDKLQQCVALLDPPVLTMGDSSQSMDVAIRTSTIVSSIMSVAVPGKSALTFFSGFPLFAACQPESINDVLDISASMSAAGATAPAAALWPAYEMKKAYKFLILATDEVENRPYRGYLFHELLAKYRAEVAPDCQVAIISFRDREGVGPMEKAMKEYCGIVPVTFRFSSARPDLTKLDQLLGLLSCSGGGLRDRIDEIHSVLEEAGALALGQPLMLQPPARKKQKIHEEHEQEKMVEEETPPLPSTLSLQTLPVDVLATVLSLLDEPQQVRMATASSRAMMKTRRVRSLWPQLFNLNLPQLVEGTYVMQKGDMYEVPLHLKNLALKDTWSWVGADTKYLDASVLAYSSVGKCLGCLDYTKRGFAGKAMKHSGDQMTSRSGTHDVRIHLPDLPQDCRYLYFVCSAWNGAKFSDIKNPKVELKDPESPDAPSLCSYNFEEAPGTDTSVLMTRLYLDGSGRWILTALGTVGKGDASNYGPIEAMINEDIINHSV